MLRNRYARAAYSRKLFGIKFSEGIFKVTRIRCFPAECDKLVHIKFSADWKRNPGEKRLSGPVGRGVARAENVFVIER